ncbi:uncharacterized protein LOC129902312 [Solanum dulcamara]|uniref:uncharacterized protein LOC129902312 n=1 Tax=Solanum dulcamara TaxID=45834 RepID=UPI002486C764|nr:uncharacterized protein LOC129902312 [Solanum dulcamara]
MEVIQFGRTLQNFPFVSNLSLCRSNKMSADRTCNSSSWTKEEDKAFENALAVYSGESDQFLKIAAAVPGKSIQEIIEHYNVLVEDINDIESGRIPLPKYERMQSSSSCRSRLSGAEVERRKGTPWTAEEHRSFLQGLAIHGKGDWRGISRNFVFSRTPTQVASHAQKFYSRLNDNNNSKRRRSIHDITSVGAANITEPSQGQKSDELIGPCGRQLQWPIADYVTEAFDAGMLSLPGTITNCTTDAIEGPSAVNPEKFPLGATLGSELNSSFPGVSEFLRSREEPIIVPAEGTSRVCHGVDTRISPSFSVQPSGAGGTGMYNHPVSFPDVHEFLRGVEDLITVPAEGTSGACHGVDTRTSPSLSLQPSVAGGTRMYNHSVTVPAESTSGARCGIDTRTSPSLSMQPSVVGDTRRYTHPVTVLAEGTSGARHGVDTRTSPSVAGGTGMYPHPVNNVGYDLEELMTKQLVGASQVDSTINTASLPLPIADHVGVHGCTASSSGTKNGFASTVGAPEGGLSVDSMQLPSIPGSSGSGTYPCWNPSSNDDSIFDLEDLFSDHIFGFGK